LHDIVGADSPLLRELTISIMTGVGADSTPTAYLETLFDAALVEIVRRYSNIGEVRDFARYAIPPARLRRVLDHIEMNLAGIVTLRDLANVAGLSPFHFSRVFQKSVGVSPMAYVIQRRIERAMTLLRASELSIANVATQSGFSSNAHFSTTFRRRVGISPNQYRNDRGGGVKSASPNGERERRGPAHPGR
jgi:AraC family transcriptional regulator